MTGIRIVNSLPEALWRQFIAENPNSNIFHTPEMFQVFAGARGFEPDLWAAVSASGAPLALLLPVRITLTSGWLQALTTRAVVFGSLLTAPGPVGLEAMALLLKDYIRQARGGPLFTELRNLADLSELQPVLSEHRFVYEPHLNYLIDLQQGPQAVFRKIGARTRKNIRHGLNRGEVRIELLEDRPRLAHCYELLYKTYRNARVPLADRSLFESAFDVLLPKGMIRFSVARVAGAYAATSLELLYKDMIYGWYGGLDRAYSGYIPNDLLTWHVLEWGAQNGYRLYDFGGAGRPDETYKVRDFKAKFGGSLVSFGRNTFVHAPGLLRMSTLGYSLLRSLAALSDRAQWESFKERDLFSWFRRRVGRRGHHRPLDPAREIDVSPHIGNPVVAAGSRRRAG